MMLGSTIRKLLRSHHLNEDFTMIASAAPTQVMKSSSEAQRNPSFLPVLLRLDGYTHSVRPRSDGLLPVGRDPGGAMHLILESDDVSYWHALIAFDPDELGYFIHDLNSANGTYVNGRPLGKERLLIEDGDVIRFGFAEANTFAAHVHTEGY